MSKHSMLTRQFTINFMAYKSIIGILFSIISFGLTGWPCRSTYTQASFISMTHLAAVSAVEWACKARTPMETSFITKLTIEKG